METTLKVPLNEMRSFPKIFHIGAPEITSLFTGPVEVTEKVDGSQIGFGKLENGELIIRSKGRVIYNGGLYHDEKMFKSAINQILSVAEVIKPGYYFYGEAVTSNKHNTLNYGKTPTGFIALYGVLTPDGWVSDHETLRAYASALGIDCVPLLFAGVVQDKAQLDALMATDSFLGNEKIEGVVVKNYKQSSTFAHSTECFGKYVREGFKERNGAASQHNKGNDLLELVSAFCTEARWHKAIQHLRDDGKLTMSPKDIGPLILEIHKDLELEEGTYIKDALYRIFIKQIKGNTTRGFPEFWKQKLLEGSFNVVKATETDTDSSPSSANPVV